MVMVTVVTPTYNSADFIAITIESVRAQTFTDWEMIIVDDCSDDITVNIVNEYTNLDPRIRLIRLAKNSGAAVSRNAAIHAAEGRYISFLDSDDRWLSHKLETQLAFIREHGAAFVFSAYKKVCESGQDLGVVGVPATVSYRKLLKSCYIGCLTAMYDTSKLGKVEMPLIRKRQDLGLWLRLLKLTPIAYGQQEILATYTMRSDSISSNKRSASAYQWKIYREVEHLSLTASCYYFTHYAIRGVLRSRFPTLARTLGVMHGVNKDNA